MEIIFFHRNPKAGFSIHRGFEPMINYLKKTDNVKEYYVPCHRATPLSLIKNVLFVYRHRTKTGVNHITGDVHYCALGLIGVPSVLTIHDNYNVINIKHGLIDKYIKILLWIIIPFLIVKRIVFITPTAQKDVLRYSLKKESVVITHQAVEDEYRYTPADFNTSCPTIFHMGTLPHKNLETTLKALSGLNCKLTVVQKMTDKQVRLANDLNIRYRNLFDLTNEEVIKEYQKSDIVVFPTLREGLGAPTIEGQSIGRPVITTNREPMNWVAGEGAVLLNNPMDPEEIRSAIERICKDETFRADLIAKGLQNIKRFSLEDIVKKYKIVYKEVTKDL